MVEWLSEWLVVDQWLSEWLSGEWLSGEWLISG